MVSQAIILVVVSGVFTIIVAISKSYHSSDGGVGAQLRLREVSHVLMRDLQGLGGEDGRAGDLMEVVDSTSSADTVSVFKTNRAQCGGGLTTTRFNTNRIHFAPDSPCVVGTAICPATVVNNQLIALITDDATLKVRVSNVNTNSGASNCSVYISPTDPDNQRALARLQLSYPPDGYPTASIDEWLVEHPPITSRVGVELSYTVVNNTLQRSVNRGLPEAIVDGVFDLQVARAYDTNGDGLIGENEWVGKSATIVTEADLAGANPVTFLASEVALVTFASAADAIYDVLPAGFENRTYTLTTEQKQRRYRWARFLFAARNRNGVAP